MSVLHATIPDFLATLARRREPGLEDHPFALLDEEESVCAASSSAYMLGVFLGMPARQARTCSPDLLFRTLDQEESESHHTALLAQMGRWQLPVESAGLGAGWIDLHTLDMTRNDVQGLASELGKGICQQLGGALAPSLGWDSSKFTSRVAAHVARTGSMRLVGKSEEVRFLSPQPTSLLPLSLPTLQQLQWLGITTLGGYAALPSTGVLQRWGAPGKMAQQWARGLDNRPVVDTLRSAPESIEVELDPPSDAVGRVLENTMQKVTALLQDLARTLRGIRRMQMRLHFVTGPNRDLSITFIDAASDPERVRAALAQRLQTLVWHDEVDRLVLQITETGELAAGQLSLFQDGNAASKEASSLVEQLAIRYGNVFFQGEIVEEAHPAHDKRSRWQAALTQVAHRRPSAIEAAQSRAAKPIRAQDERLLVECGATGRPSAFRCWGSRQHVERVVQSWEVVTDWWESGGEIRRSYHAVITRKGLFCVLYHDSASGEWHLAKTYD
jgi:hypothetical protein